MGKGFAQTIVMGNMGRDPELRYTGSGRPVMTCSVAVTRNFKVGEEWKEATTWYRVELWGPAAERAAENARRGNFVRVIGSIETYDQQKDGQTVHGWKLMARQFDVLDKPAGSAGRAIESASTSGRAPAGGQGEYGDLDDLPF